MPKPDHKIEYVPYTVIENKLLAALDGGDKVAIAVGEDDLETLCRGLANLANDDAASRLLAGLRKLQRGAFG